MPEELIVQHKPSQTSLKFEVLNEAPMPYAWVNNGGDLFYKSLPRNRYSKRQVKKIIAKLAREE